MHPIEKHKRITGDERDQLKALLRRRYERGASIRMLAEQTGRSYGFVHGILKEAGVTLRGRNENGRRKRGRGLAPASTR